MLVIFASQRLVLEWQPSIDAEKEQLLLTHALAMYQRRLMGKNSAQFDNRVAATEQGKVTNDV